MNRTKVESNDVAEEKDSAMKKLNGHAKKLEEDSLMHENKHKTQIQELNLKMSEVTNQLNHERQCSVDLEKKTKERTEKLKKCEEEAMLQESIVVSKNEKTTQLEIQLHAFGQKHKTCDEEDTKSDITSDDKQLNSEIKENDP